MTQLADNSRVWVFQADRPLSMDEIKWLSPKFAQFVKTWQSHGRQLNALAEIRYQRFLIVMVDQKAFSASGCSIDTLHHFMQELEKALNVQLFDRMNIAYKENGEVKSIGRIGFEELIKAGKINDDTIVFNNLISDKAGLDKSWEIPLKSSWHKQMFSVANA